MHEEYFGGYSGERESASQEDVVDALSFLNMLQADNPEASNISMIEKKEIPKLRSDIESGKMETHTIKVLAEKARTVKDIEGGE